MERAVKSTLPVTPDSRYFVVRGRLWRCTNPFLSAEVKKVLVDELMQARREKGSALRCGDNAGREVARHRIDEIKKQLGERGPVWWSDGAPDWNRQMAKNTPYADWYAGLPS